MRTRDRHRLRSHSSYQATVASTVSASGFGGHPGPAGPVRGEAPLVEFRAHPPLAAGRLPGAVRGHHRSPGLAVRVRRAECDQPGPGRLDGRQDG
ncbi:hypothetical protein KBY55_14170 [Streptomyces sp. b94]|uniref:hypothetical protein n=1 Tax=Streptomyces sp. b94 TaxID=1827634 RepID=UPI001B39C089|nr:hypothetical protein [Streptomyces sp. b94]